MLAVEFFGQSGGWLVLSWLLLKGMRGKTAQKTSSGKNKKQLLNVSSCYF